MVSRAVALRDRYSLMLNVAGPPYLVGTHRSGTLTRATWIPSIALYMAVSYIWCIEAGEKYFAFLSFAVITSSRDAASLITAFVDMKLANEPRAGWSSAFHIVNRCLGVFKLTVCSKCFLVRELHCTGQAVGGTWA